APRSACRRCAPREARYARRRAMGRLRIGGQRPWPEARALRSLPFHPAGGAGALGTRLARLGRGRRVHPRLGRGGRRALAVRAARAPRWLGPGLGGGPLPRPVYALPPPRFLPGHGAAMGL